MTTYYHDFTRPSGSIVTVEYKYTDGSGDYFAGGRWMPGDDPEVEIVKVFDDDSDDIQLSDEEYEHAEVQIYANPPEHNFLPDDVV